MDLFGSSGKIFFARGLKSIIGFASITVFARELGPDPLGIYYPFVALAGFALIPGDLGINSALTKRLSENNKRSRFLGASLLLKFATICVPAGAIIMMSTHVDRFLGSELTSVLVLFLFFDGASSLSKSVLYGELRVGEAAILDVIRPMGWLLFGYFFILQGLGAEGLIYGYFLGTIFTGIIGWWKVDTHPMWPQKEQFYSLINFGKYGAVSSIGGLFYSWIDVLVLTAFVTLSINVTRGDVGAYENAWRISLILMLVSRTVATVLFPQISEWDKNDVKKRIELSIQTSIFFTLLFVVPGVVGIFLLSDDLLRILFGAEFTVASTALIILAAGKIADSIRLIFNNTLNAVDRPDLPAIAAVTSALLNIVLNILFIWYYGVTGAAIATVISSLANTLIHIHYINNMLEIHIPVKKFRDIIISSIMMGVYLWLSLRLVGNMNLISLVLVIVSGVTVYSTLVLILPATRSEILRILSSRIYTLRSLVGDR